jgi:hypothetical protein
MTRKQEYLAVALTAIMVLAVMAVVPAAAEAESGRTLVVDDSFTEPGENTDSDLQFTSLQSAVDEAHPGDTVEVRAGTYHESVLVDKELTIEGAGASATTLIGNGSKDAPTMHVGTDNIEVTGFTIQTPPEGNANPALFVLDVTDSHVLGAHIHDNVIAGDDDTYLLAGAAPPSGTQTARQLTIEDNRFEGGTVGSMGYGLYLDARNSHVSGNVFDVKVSEAVVYVGGPGNTFQNTTIEWPGPAHAGFAIGYDGDDTTVTDLSVDGHPDEHVHVDDWLDYGVYVAGSGSTLTDVSSVDSHVGVYVGGTEEEYVTDVTLRNFDGVRNLNHDLKIAANAKRVTVDGFEAQSMVYGTAQHGWGGTTGSNVWAAGEDHALGGITTTSAAPTGIWTSADGTTISSASVENKQTGIALDDADQSTVRTSQVMANAVGISAVDSRYVSIVHNNPGIANNSDVGVWLDDANNATLRDNDVRANGMGLKTVSSTHVRALYNNFVESGTAGIYATDGSSVDARWNWFGADNGPGGSATDGVLTGSGDAIEADSSSDIWYDAFLTAPKDDVIQDPDKTVQYAHDFVMAGSQGLQSIGFPAPGQVQFQVQDDDGDAIVWAYDDGEFMQLTSANPQVETLDAFIVGNLDHGENARVVVDFADQPNAPGSKSLEEGWNFVAAPQYGDAEDVLTSTGSIERVTQAYDQAASQPRPSTAPSPTASVFSYPMGSDADGPTLSAYGGYWIYVTESGQLVAAVPPGVTLNEEPGTITT